MDSQEVEEQLFDPKIPEVNFCDAIIYFAQYGVSLPDDYLNKIDNLSPSMIKIINNIITFKCTSSNIIRQAKLYFSKYISIFVFEILSNVLEIPFRMEISCEIIESLISGNSLLPYLLFSFLLMKESQQSFFSHHTLSSICQAVGRYATPA